MPNETARRIVKDSLHSFLCIDDKIVPPYSESREDDTFSKEMFQSFYDTQKQLKLYHYDGNQADVTKVKEHFSGIDILILDWQLDGESFGDTLKILAEAIKFDDIKHIFIYTSAVDTNQNGLEKVVYPIFRAFQNNHISDEQMALIDAFFDGYIDNIDNIIREIASDVWMEVKENKKTPGRLLSKIMPLINGDEKQEFVEKKKEYDLLLSSWLHEKTFAFTPESNAVEFLEEFVLKSHGNFILANGKPIHIVGKEEAKNELLLQRITDSIIEDPNSYFGLLNYEVLQVFKKKFFHRAKEIALINDSVIKKHCHYGAEACTGEFSIESLIKNVYKEAFSSIFSHDKLDLIDYAPAHFDGVSDEVSDEKKALMYLNYITSMNLSKNSKNIHDPKIEFGDIFKLNWLGDYKYAICITPHCDCLRPSKIDGQYLFVFSRKASNGESEHDLEKLDSKFVSFVEDDSYKIIDWREDPSKCDSFIKPKTIYIDNDKNDITKDICALYNKDFFTMTFVGQQKESFTQRLANEASRYPTRVGVDYLSINN